MDKPYTMKPAEVPKRGGRVASSVYKDALEDFLAQDAKSVSMSFEGRKPTTVALKLRKAVKSSGAAVEVVQRAGVVYLMKS